MDLTACQTYYYYSVVIKYWNNRTSRFLERTIENFNVLTVFSRKNLSICQIATLQPTVETSKECTVFAKM